MARLAKVPVLDPSDPQEAREMVGLANGYLRGIQNSGDPEASHSGYPMHDKNISFGSK